MTVVGVAMAIVTATAMADDFGPVRYDPNGNQLIVTMIYEGTNPNHHFSVKWGECRKLEGFDQPTQKLMDVWILDDQGDDAAKKTFKKTLHVPLPALPCRPATVTLLTYPLLNGGGRATVDIP
jgi:hypothetical protein